MAVMETIVCKICSNQVTTLASNKRSGFCSLPCYWESKKGSKGYWYGKERKELWRGSKTSYSALHTWVRRRLGTPGTCEHCGKTGLKARQIHWANKSHKYKKELNDWIRLCVKCHMEYDH